MGKDHLGHPSGVNKPDADTGVPAGKYVQDEKKDKELTDKYAEGEESIAENIRQNNPNRNTDKDGATNTGGYKGGTS